jgi:hypothetical protein
MVKIEGTLDELRELLGSAERSVRAVRDTVSKGKKVASKTQRKLSSWQRYLKSSSNHIKFKSGPKKGRLDLAKMSKAFKRSNKK